MCGNSPIECKSRLDAAPFAVNTEFTSQREICIMGPWVQERVHGGRPEIHPGEAIWSRKPGHGDWRVAIVPDASKRFDRDKYFKTVGENPAVAPAWAADRQIEFLFAFEGPAGEMVLDLARLCLGRNQAPVLDVGIQVPGPVDAFAAVERPLAASLNARIRTWPHHGGLRGLIHLKSSTRSAGCDAVLLGVVARHRNTPPDGLELKPLGSEPPSVLLRAINESKKPKTKNGRTFLEVKTRAGFGSAKPGDEAGERVAGRLNDALAHDKATREASFGTAMPFEIDWTIQAWNDKGQLCSPGCLSRGDVKSARGERVIVEIRPSGIVRPPKLNGIARVAGTALPGAGAQWIADLRVSAPLGWTLKGTAHVTFVASRPELDASSKRAGAAFRHPLSKAEWALIEDAFQALGGSAAENGLKNFKEAACEPLGANCSIADLARHVGTKMSASSSLEERVALLQTLEEPERSFARYVRWLAASYVHDGSATAMDEQNIRDLIRKACSGTGPLPRFCK
jgi:hypothetical protein